MAPSSVYALLFLSLASSRVLAVRLKVLQHSEHNATDGSCWSMGIAEEWARLGLKMVQRADRPLVQCKDDDDSQVSFKISCVPEECDGDSWCFVENGCGGWFSGRCKKLPDVPVKCRSKNIADMVSENVRPDLKTVLGDQPCQDWHLLSVEEIVLPTSFTDGLRVKQEFSVQATLYPTGRILKGRHVEGSSGNPNLHFYFDPSTTDKITFDVFDHGAVSSSVDWKVDLRSFKGHFEISQKGGWRNKITHKIAGHVSHGAEMDAKAKNLIVSGVELTETFAPFFDGPSSLSDWNAYRKHLTKWALYRAGGMSEEAVPGQAMLEAYEAKCYEDCKLAPVITKGQTRIIGYDYVVRAMKNMGPQLQCNNQFRRNELGSNILNGVYWPEKPNHAIGLGDSVVDHGLMRPWLDRLVGTKVAEDKDTLKFIAAKAGEFLASGSFNSSSSGQYVTKVLHKYHTFMDIDDAFAKEFSDNQMSVVAEIMIPDKFSDVGKLFFENQPYKEKLLGQYKANLAARLGEEWSVLSSLQQDKFASNLLDSLLFAGGLSVPTVIQMAFAVLYGHWGVAELEKHQGAGWTLTNDNVEQFTQEVFRRFPAVGAFPTWDRETNTHNQVDLRAANLQKSAAGWGDSAMDFKLRSMDEYEQKQISWGNMAMVNNDPGHPESHVCPGRVLSIKLVEGILKEFIKTGGKKCWEADLPTKEIMVGASTSSALQLTRKPDCVV